MVGRYILILVGLVWARSGYGSDAGGRECFIPTIENGWVEGELGENSYTGKVRCNHGFELVGGESVLCNQGQWTQLEPVFCAAISPCEDDLPELENGFKQSVSGYRDSVYRMECNPGYRLVGQRTVYCTKEGWNTANYPVCAKTGCNLKELLGDGIKHGGSRSELDGSLVRFFCDHGSTMSGPSTVYCDGETWSGGQPICQVPPSTPILTVTVSGQPRTEGSVVAGEEIHLKCSTQEGHPTPAVTLSLNGEGETGSSEVSFTHTVREHPHTLNITCQAENAAVQSPVEASSLSFPVIYAASRVTVSGPPSSLLHSTTSLSCSSSPSQPVSMVWVQAWNQDLQSLPVLINSEDTEGAEVIFTVTPESGTREVVVECRAENTAGNVTATHTMDVLFPPTSVVIEGEKETLSAGQKYQYRCSVAESHPPCQQSWEMYDSSMEQVSYTHLDQETEEVEVVVPYNTHTITIVCTASNSVGKLTESLDITVTRPPSQPQVTGPSSIPEDSPRVFLCSVTDPGNPPAEISWSIVNIHGEEVTWSQGTHTQDESQIEVSPSRNDREVTVSCSATNTVSTIQEATKATVTYLPTTITMTAPSSITRGDSLLLHCFTDSSFPSVSLTWSLEGEVETESVLGDSGTIQTHSSLRVVDTTQLETGDNHIQVQCCLETGELCDTRTVEVKGPTPLVLLNLAMTAAENDTEDVRDDETNELDQITSELERNEYIGENNAVNFSLNGLKEDGDTTTDTDTEGKSEQSEQKNISDDTDAIDASINEMTVDINTVKESPLSVDHVALMLNSESPPSVFLCIHVIFSIILLKLYL